MSIVNVEKLTHYYGDKLVFKDIDFRLLRSERVGLVGPNGAGKSTLLRILTGSVLPDHGSIEWLPNISVGFLEQHADLSEGLTIRNYLRNAFKHLYLLEAEMLDVSRKMENSSENELPKLLHRFGYIQELLEHHDFYFVDAKIEDIANGLGIQALGMDTDVSALSGGQRTKLLLANLLLKEPDILLLDEPTNYLDVSHIEWLKGYLKNYPNSFILISHDTEFMNEVVNVIYHLENYQLTRYLGNYKKFMETYELRKQQLLLAYGRQQEEIQKLETYIQKNKARSSTAKQAKSREKKLLKIERLEKPDDIPKPRFQFKATVRPTSKIIETTQLEVGYASPLLPPISVTLKRGDKVAIIGHNGIGKSTMLKTIMGELTPFNGTVQFGQYVKPAYFAQEENITTDLTPLEYIWSFHEKMTQKEIRQALARAGLKKEHIFQPLQSLSGGEQTRVRLCHLMLEESNWLVLDEPTNHLDIAAKEVLSNALSQYDGTVLIVSHEPEFYQDWVTAIWNLEDLKNNIK
ncbi:ABC-F family ATP-binding cassette domain-containing protein [Bacillus sp. FJAT-49736]|uniref:ABC-F family ATP-binding cassette domain-containing protein n=1 Tax=Bacillus sp. FJAT-49736 TaxID=2833582 RepID=UPI001BC94124|nr:ABC-F family ATP-binding cassette domain-containing protein [Bacillus sp. FJAT-49736]MBS4173052.1 ABC-F family ATP-binding cassette domain-containing protein [Bacillus sp. FJAT-49736]